MALLADHVGGALSPARYTEGIVAVIVLGVGLWVTSGVILARWLPAWHGGPVRLAKVILGIGMLIAVAELLGTIGQLHLPALLICVGAIALAAWVSSRFTASAGPAVTESPSAPVPRRSEGWWESAGAIVSVALVAGEWSPATINAFRTGMVNIDSLWYHMPIAAGFAQSGSVVTLHNINSDNVIAFYPATSELVHALGILLMGNDVLSPLLNMAWLALALFAAWCLGTRFGVGSLAVMATAVVMGTTELVADEPGGAYNDVVGVALVLSAVALLVSVGVFRDRRSDLAGLLVAALATGLALGVKYTFIFPVIALTVGAIVLVPRGRRLRNGAAWVAVVLVGGGLWYLRNFIEAGNPLPNVHVHVAGIHLPSPKSAASVTVWHVIFHAQVWTADVLPGLSQAFGPGWWFLSVTAAFGLVAGLLGGVGHQAAKTDRLAPAWCRRRYGRTSGRRPRGDSRRPVAFRGRPRHAGRLSGDP